jgi:Zn-dependent protease with chaperone function
MTHDEFAALVARLEGHARRNPGAYRARVIALALAGYAYLAVVIAVLAVLLGGAIYSIAYAHAVGIKLALVTGIFLWVVLKALWIRFGAPDGIEVRRSEAPELFARIEGLRTRLRAKRFHHVLITNDFNAAVVQRPLLGIFGWHTNYLLIGLPLMKSLTPAQLEAVLAHEFGHLAGGHARLSNWVYRLRLSWQRLLTTLQARESIGLLLFKPFFMRYAPYFEAYSFPLARANEYEADAASARIASPRAAAEALTAVEIAGRYFEERFWPELHRQADDLPQPAFAPFSAMGERLAGEIDETHAQQWLDRAMARETTVDNTHPSLADRLKALGEPPRRAPPGPGSAADTLLGAALEGITRRFDDAWRDGIAKAWGERHSSVQQARARLVQLDAQAARGAPLSVDEGVERALLTERHGAGSAAAIEQLRALHQRDPGNAHVLFNLGRCLLANDDESGFTMIECVVGVDPLFVAAGAKLLRDYCWRKGQQQEAGAWHARLAQAEHTLELARRERAEVRKNDRFEPHGLDDAMVAALRAQLGQVSGLREAYLVRKQVEHIPQLPLLVMGFGFKPSRAVSDERLAADAQRTILATVKFPHECIVFSLEGDNASFRPRLDRVAGSRVL